jgi:DNA-nicking Smr family endonuclease
MKMKRPPPEPSKSSVADRGPSLGELVGPVRPLRPAAKRVPPVKPHKSFAQPLPPAPRVSYDRHASLPAFSVEDDGAYIEGGRAGHETALRDLARGRLPTSATFDLHGFTSDEAERKLHRFFAQHQGPRRCVVLVVHGRGSHSAGGRGVLRDQIAAWLSGPPFADMVICFATARPRDGGGGALYVLLSAHGRSP